MIKGYTQRAPNSQHQAAARRLRKQKINQQVILMSKTGAQRKRDHDQRQRDMGRKLAQWWVTPEEKTALFVKLLEIRRGNDND